MDWIAVDLDWLERYSVAFRSDWRELKRIKRELPSQMDAYRVQAIENGVVVLKHDGAQKPALERQLRERLARRLPADPREQVNKKP